MASLVKLDNIPPTLVVNIDQTWFTFGSYKWFTSGSWTWEKMGPKQMNVHGAKEKKKTTFVVKHVLQMKNFFQVISWGNHPLYTLVIYLICFKYILIMNYRHPICI